MKLIFTLTAGRTGTAYLASLLGDNISHAKAYHEWIGCGTFGSNTPAIRHFIQFNCHGNTDEVKSFWQKKYKTILEEPTNCYIETSHMLMKAGLVENMLELAKDHQIHFIILTRNIKDTVISYCNRFDFQNRAAMWLWGLDPDFPRNILKLADDRKRFPDIYIWYAYEILARAYYYRLKYSNLSNVHFHEYDLYALQKPETVAKLLGDLGVSATTESIIMPGKKNESRNTKLIVDNAYIAKMVEKVSYDVVEIAESFLQKPNYDW